MFWRRGYYYPREDKEYGEIYEKLLERFKDMPTNELESYLSKFGRVRRLFMKIFYDSEKPTYDAARDELRTRKLRI